MLSQPRSIPTRVGNTFYGFACPVSLPVHPHACGEYTFSAAPCKPNRGPSPRVWGIRAISIQIQKANWPIPTRERNTSVRLFLPYQSPVHPHACENYNCEHSKWYHLLIKAIIAVIGNHENPKTRRKRVTTTNNASEAISSRLKLFPTK